MLDLRPETVLFTQCILNRWTPITCFHELCRTYSYLNSLQWPILKLKQPSLSTSESFHKTCQNGGHIFQGHIGGNFFNLLSKSTWSYECGFIFIYLLFFVCAHDINSCREISIRLFSVIRGRGQHVFIWTIVYL